MSEIDFTIVPAEIKPPRVRHCPAWLSIALIISWCFSCVVEREAGGPALLALGLSVADSIYYSHRVYPVLCLVVGCIVAAWFAARAKSGGESYLYTFSAGILLAATFIGFASSGYWPVPITVVPFGCFWVYFVVRMAKAFRKNGGIQFSMRTLLRFLVFASLVFATTSASAFLPRSI